MGTNYYWIGKRGAPAGQIGKRSAAGLYCWDCDVTLCRDGNSQIHHGPANIRHDALGHVDWSDYAAKRAALWDECCPKCGQPPVNEDLKESSAGMELGFAKPKTERPTGVRSCSSFSWAQDPAKARDVCRKRARETIVCDEYGGQFRGAEFLEMLEMNCPVEFTDSIGTHFS